jgi:hypothetical protein
MACIIAFAAESSFLEAVGIATAWYTFILFLKVIASLHPHHPADSSDSSSSSSSSSSCDEEEQGTCPNAAATRQLKLQERQAAAAAGQVPTATTEEGLAVQRDLQARMDADRKAAKQQRKQAERAAKELQKKAEKAAKAQRKEEKRGRKVAAMAVAAAEAEAAANPGRHSPSELPYPRAAVAQLEGEEEALEEGEQAGGKPLSWLLGQLLRCTQRL